MNDDASPPKTLPYSTSDTMVTLQFTSTTIFDDVLWTYAWLVLKCISIDDTENPILTEPSLHAFIFPDGWQHQRLPCTI